MDVTTSRFPVVPEVSSPRRFVPPNPPESTAEAHKTLQAKRENTAWEPRSLLKFSVKAADVDARFEIHEATSRVIVTIFDRETGEVLSEVPSRHVLDVIAAVTSNGLHVDTSS